MTRLYSLPPAKEPPTGDIPVNEDRTRSGRDPGPEREEVRICNAGAKSFDFIRAIAAFSAWVKEMYFGCCGGGGGGGGGGEGGEGEGGEVLNITDP